jgi:hypothetical protein
MMNQGAVRLSRTLLPPHPTSHDRFRKCWSLIFINNNLTRILLDVERHHFIKVLWR